MKILVTGSNGQLGRHIRQALAKTSWNYILLSHKDLDITDRQCVRNALHLHLPDIVINAAAYTSVEKAESHPELAHMVNATGAGHLSQVANTINAAIVHISTDYVFSGTKAAPYTEDDPTAPANIYGKSKSAGELQVIANNPKHLILRTSWVFSEYGTNFLQTMQRLSKERDRISVVHDQFGGPTYARDLANALIKIITHYQTNKYLKWGIYHYCGLPFTSWFELAQEIFQHLKPSPTLIPISTTEYGNTVNRPYNSRLDCTKINKAFGIEPSNWKLAIQKLCRLE